MAGSPAAMTALRLLPMIQPPRHSVLCLAGRGRGAGASGRAGRLGGRGQNDRSAHSDGKVQPREQQRQQQQRQQQQQQQGQQQPSSSSPRQAERPRPPRGSGGYVSATKAAAAAVTADGWKDAARAPLGSRSAPMGSPVPEYAQLLVVGGGAAGLTAAYFAARAGAAVTVLERTREAGKKILMSGGSRCNVMPAHADVMADFTTSSAAGALRALMASWSLDECREWLSADDDVGLQLQLEPHTAKLFPQSGSSREVRDRLVAACSRVGVRFVYSASVEELRPPAQQGSEALQEAVQDAGRPAQWTVTLANGARVRAARIVMCTGGRSFPAVGTDGTGTRLLASLGHTVTPEFAALTPIKGRHPGGHQLAGVTMPDAQLSVLRPMAASVSSSSSSSKKPLAVAPRGGLLFTHRGYSGPAVLDVSHWVVQQLDRQPPAPPEQMPRLVVDWTGEGAEAWHVRLAAASGASTVETLLRRGGLPDRLAAALTAELGVTTRQLGQLRRSERDALLAALSSWVLPVSGHEGYKKAEVTGGGVLLQELDVRTLESRLPHLRGLHIAGEALDVFGRIGGFNFALAWVSGRAAGLGAAAALGLHTDKKAY